MGRPTKEDVPEVDDKVKEPIHRSGITGRLYAIFRVSEKKYKSIDMIRHYQNHMERQVNTPNADTTISNEILIGNSNIVGTVQEYIKDVKLRTNSVLARDLLLTASPSFFRMSLTDKRKWVDLNVTWLKEKFGDNCMYATLHKDESTWHISALIVPRFWDEKKNRYILANSRYFDGIEKLRKWQDEYSSGMQKAFKSLNRGIRFSKAKHIEVRHYYAMINTILNKEDIKQVCAKAINSELMERQVNNLQETLNMYSDSLKNAEKNNYEIYEALKNIKRDKEVYKETIKAMSEIYKIPQNAVIKIINYVEGKVNNNEEITGPERELKK